MKKRIAPFASMGLLLLCFSSNAYPQTMTTLFRLSIAVEQNTLSLPKGAKVRVKMENKTGRTIVKGELLPLSVTLTKLGKHAEDCRRDDCFIATYPLKGLNAIKDGEAFEFKIDLAGLYWNDEVSNSYNFNEPENMPEVIHAGTYNLSVSLDLPSDLVEVKSNRLLVKVQ